MKVVFFLVFFSVFSCISAQNWVNYTSTFEVTVPSNNEFAVYVFDNLPVLFDATLETLNEQKEVVVCVKNLVNVPPSASPSLWNKELCNNGLFSLGNHTHNTTANSTAGFDEAVVGSLTGGGRAPEEFYYESFKSGGSGYGSGSVNAEPNKVDVSLRAAPVVYFAVAFADATEPFRPVNFVLQGKKCTNEHELGPLCTTPTSIPNGESINKTVSPFEPTYLVFSVPSNVGKLTVTARNREDHAEVPVQVYVRRGNAPTEQDHDAKSAPVNDEQVATVALPAAANNWYAEVQANETADVNLEASFPTCGDDKAGEDCNIQVTEVSTNPGQLVRKAITAGAVHYYKFKPANGTRLAVNVQSMTGQQNPTVYVRWGVIPLLGSVNEYDIKDCTEVPARCKAVAVRSVAGVAQEQPWFITVVGNADGEYGIWNAENDACPDNCNGNGDCTGSINGGVCECHEDFVGLIDCSQGGGSNSGLETWEWVLIVIGIIIAAVIIIGLAVYFVRRAQSRAGFERV